MSESESSLMRLSNGIPFPDDVPLANIATVSLKRLQDGDAREQARLFQACKDNGFFYLELADTRHGKTILEGAEQAVHKAAPFFAQSLDDKNAWSLAPSGGGYKTPGLTKVNNEGRVDNVENFNISTVDVITNGPPIARDSWPDFVTRDKPFFAEYARASHAIGMLVLETLAEQLGSSAEDIRNRHHITEASGAHIRVLRIPPNESLEDAREVCFPAHTDFGPLTILVNWIGGLQLYSASARAVSLSSWGEDMTRKAQGEWQWAKPKPDCAIINLGDAAVLYSNGVLCSSRHRVVPPPGEQKSQVRYSIGYFMRPDDHTILTNLPGTGPSAGLEGDGMTAQAWIRQKVQAVIDETKRMQEAQAVVTAT